VIKWEGTTEALTHFRAIYRLGATPPPRRRSHNTTTA
jgi:hypothetical protein